MIRSLLLLTVLSTTVVYAQSDTTRVLVPRAALTTEQISTLEIQNIKDRAEAYGAWVGVGKEIGEAVNSSLLAVTDHANKFADTKVGKVVSWLVIWKVLGSDILSIVFSMGVAFIGLPIVFWSYKRTLQYTYVSKEDRDSTGKITNVEYKAYDSSTINDKHAAQFIHAVVAAILLASIAIALFS